MRKIEKLIRDLPEGPAIWICGDCHVGNLGPVADEHGRVAVQIRDFDQTVIGNPAHDLVRLGLSLATAARSANLPGITTARMMEALFDGYERAFDPRRSEEIRKAQRPSAVRVAMKEALHRSWRQLARQNIAGTAPRIPVGKRFWPLTNRETAQIRAMFEADDGAALASVMRQARPGVKVDVLDAAYWVKGCSSLGRLRYAVLVDIDHACADGGTPCLIDIKEAAAVAAPRYPHNRMPQDNAGRVVEGAVHMSPFLGERMKAARLCDRSVVLREPQDLKLEVEERYEQSSTIRWSVEVAPSTGFSTLVLAAEARLGGFGGRQTGIEVALKTLYGLGVGVEGRADKFRFDGFVVPGARPLVQVQQARRVRE